MVGHKVDIMTTEATETSRAIKESPYMVFKKLKVVAGVIYGRNKCIPARVACHFGSC